MTKRDERIADAARRYVAAVHALEGERFGGAGQIELAAAYHELLVIVDERCSLCDWGSCPLEVEIVDVEVQGQLL